MFNIPGHMMVHSKHAGMLLIIIFPPTVMWVLPSPVFGLFQVVFIKKRLKIKVNDDLQGTKNRPSFKECVLKRLIRQY